MDLSQFTKKIVLPAGFEMPKSLTYQDLRAEPLTRQHLKDDLAGINASIELIPKTRGGDWPTGPSDEAEEFTYLIWHELEFEAGYSFTYIVYDAKGNFVGDFYLYPMGRRVSLTDDLARYDIDASWWVVPDAYKNGYYTKLYNALKQWLAKDFPFKAVYYSNKEIPA